jgi:hypothetical protein
MYIKNRAVSSVFRVILVLVAAYGIFLNVAALGGNAWEILSYYTLQSNILVMVFFAALLARQLLGKKGFPPVVKGAVTLCITITFLVYHFILQPTLFEMSGGSYVLSGANLIVHYIVPLMTLADWLLFDEKGRFKRIDPVKWLVIPLAYFIFALARAQFASFAISGSRYPYFFMDVDKYGVGQVAVNVVLIGAGFAVLGYIIFFIDWFLAKRLTKM